MTNFTERQNQIIQASLDLIANSGIHGLTIKNISKKIGISEPAIYRHFESKTDILLGIISKIKESSTANAFVIIDEEQTTVEAFKYAGDKNISVVVMEPLKGGQLANLPESITSIFDESDYDCEIVERSFRWLANRPEVKVILSGMSTLNQIIENIQLLKPFLLYTDFSKLSADLSDEVVLDTAEMVDNEEIVKDFIEKTEVPKNLEKDVIIIGVNVYIVAAEGPIRARTVPDVL